MQDRRPTSGLLGILVALLPAYVSAQPASQPAANDASQLQRGQFHITFTEQSPLSPIEAQYKRYHIKVEPAHRYTLADESFEAFVPEDYDPAQSYGLLVWTNASKSGAPSKGWLPILTKNRLIWIGGNNCGNERGIGVRMGLALDAVQNFRKVYNIDESRIYASGVSGGGKIASMLAMIYPEIFAGAMPMAGVAYFRPIQAPTSAGQYPPTFERPAALPLDRARQQSRFVLLTGSNDFNRDPIKATYEQGFGQDGFKHVEYVEVPGMGHGVPDAERVEAAIHSLDAPLPGIAKDQFIRAQGLEKGGKPAEALKLYQAALPHLEESLADKARARIDELQQKTSLATPGPKPPVAATDKPPQSKAESDEAAAQQLLSLASSYEQNKLLPQAKQRLERIISDYPNTKAAAQARAALQRINSRPGG